MNFNLPYDRGKYTEFFRNQFLPEDFEQSGEPIPLTFSPQYTQQVTKIGQSRSLDLNVYEVEHTSENDPRVSLSKESFRLLAKYGQKRALVLFVSKTSENYRLSLVTIDLKWEEGKRPIKEYSNPRRFSFFLGPQCKAHTPQQYLKDRIKDLDDLKERFSIEVVNKDFFTEIALLFTKLTGGTRKVKGKTIDEGKGCLKLPDTRDDTIKKEFAVRLIGRLIFCWFLKKKTSKANIQLIPDDVLSTEAIKNDKGVGSYYHSVLEPLFFEVLNTPIDNRKKDYKKASWNLIPFLNGGLFNPHDDDFYKLADTGYSQHLNTLIIPDKWLKDLLEFFETYNFTIDENTPVDVELSIEPEMLGRIFENLLAEINPETGETARKATGSYYTPRPIVEYMVDESLKQYLLVKTSVSETEVTSLLSYADEEPGLADSQKKEVLDALDTIKVIDPACGSGAFPIGVLQKILLLLQKIDPDSKRWLGKMLAKIDDPIVRKEFERKLEREALEYVHKLGIIRDAIYGVDIQPIAVEISKLRCFLSLIVDETIDDTQPNRAVEPLPNLEFKFVCANSLVGLDSSRLTTQKAMELKDRLKKLRADYLVSYGDEKRHTEQEFRQIQSEMARMSLDWGEGTVETLKLADWKPFEEKPCGWFDPEWMFGIKRGFDIVIANPPYIKEYTNRNAFDGLRENPYYQGKMDIWYFFGSIGFDFLKSEGVECFIATNNWISNAGASKFRNKVMSDSQILQFIDFGNFKVFETTGIQTMVYLLKKTSAAKVYTLDYAKLTNDKIDRDDLCKFLTAGASGDDFLKYEVSFKRNEFKDKYITFLKPEINQLLDKVTEGDNLYLTANEIAQGIVAPQTFLNESGARKLEYRFVAGQGIFRLTSKEKNDLKLSKKELDIIKPYYTTEELRRYCGDKNNKYWLIYSKSDMNSRIEDFPNIKKHLDQFKDIITSAFGPYGLHRARDERFFIGNKIVCLRKCEEPTLTYVDFDCYISQTFYVIKTERIALKYLTGLLNSKLIAFWLFHKGKLQGNLFQVDKVPLMNIPIAEPDKETQCLIGTLVDYIILLKKQQAQKPSDKLITSYFEQIIDGIVFELYFEQELKGAGREILKYTTDLKPIDNKMTDAQKMQVIKSEFDRLYDRKHPIRNNLFYMDTIPEIRSIKGLDKDAN